MLNPETASWFCICFFSFSCRPHFTVLRCICLLIPGISGSRMIVGPPQVRVILLVGYFQPYKSWWYFILPRLRSWWFLLEIECSYVEEEERSCSSNTPSALLTKGTEGGTEWRSSHIIMFKKIIPSILLSSPSHVRLVLKDTGWAVLLPPDFSVCQKLRCWR